MDMDIPAELTLEDVKRLIDEKIYHIHAIRPKDKAKKRNLDYYEVFYLIYDKTTKVVPDFYWCSICKILFQIDLKANGTAQFTRHACFKQYMTEKAEKDKQEKAENENVQLQKKKKKNEPIVVDPDYVPEDKGQDENKHVDVPQANDGNPSDTLTKKGRDILMKAFIEYGDVCSKFGALNAKQLEKIVPSSLNSVQWKIFSKEADRMMNLPACSGSSGNTGNSGNSRSKRKSSLDWKEEEINCVESPIVQETKDENEENEQKTPKGQKTKKGPNKKPRQNAKTQKKPKKSNKKLDSPASDLESVELSVREEDTAQANGPNDKKRDEIKSPAKKSGSPAKVSNEEDSGPPAKCSKALEGKSPKIVPRNIRNLKSDSPTNVSNDGESGSSANVSNDKDSGPPPKRSKALKGKRSNIVLPTRNLRNRKK